MKKVIFIHNNYEPEHIPKSPDPEDRFYTYGFSSTIARNFKKYYPELYEKLIEKGAINEEVPLIEYILSFFRRHVEP